MNSIQAFDVLVYVFLDAGSGSSSYLQGPYYIEHTLRACQRVHHSIPNRACHFLLEGGKSGKVHPEAFSTCCLVPAATLSQTYDVVLPDAADLKSNTVWLE